MADEDQISNESVKNSNDETERSLQLNVPHGVHPGSGTVPLGGETKEPDREA